MVKEVQTFFEENGETEYLFIVGNKKDKSSLPIWKYASINYFMSDANSVVLNLRCLS